MQVVDLDGGYHNWSLIGNTANKSTTRSTRSSYHLDARKLLHEQYTTAQILEEVEIPLRTKERAYLDFYISTHKIAVEVHGEQHFKYIPHFHGSKLNFLKAQKRDKDKEEWCRINGIEYIVLPCDNIVLE